MEKLTPYNQPYMTKTSEDNNERPPASRSHISATSMGRKITPTAIPNSTPAGAEAALPSSSDGFWTKKTMIAIQNQVFSDPESDTDIAEELAKLSLQAETKGYSPGSYRDDQLSETPKEEPPKGPTKARNKRHCKQRSHQAKPHRQHSYPGRIRHEAPGLHTTTRDQPFSISVSDVFSPPKDALTPNFKFGTSTSSGTFAKKYTDQPMENNPAHISWMAAPETTEFHSLPFDFSPEEASSETQKISAVIDQ
ncbi:hypothetical protein [Endozoicomonas atrinae]|uniref:hypothetical protein n=1 Tax=Endozoicomonas atrinae TaxID=1333660 RepID=UPI0008243EA7|nr:hypothetical protein [Endozoicomonas atrinae]